jgi:hypothetical protein
MRLIILIMGNSICSVTNSEEVACEGEGSKKPVHSDDRKASSEKTDVNGPGTSCFFCWVLEYFLYWLYSSIILILENIYSYLLRSLFIQHKFTGLSSD